MPEEKDYDVGYKRPPKWTRFKAGQSGNPKGRPKNTKDFDKLMDRELSEPMRIKDQGQPLTIPTREVAIKALINMALKGNFAALKLVIGFMTSQHTIEGFEPDAGDRRALMALLKTMELEDEGHKERCDE